MLVSRWRARHLGQDIRAERAREISIIQEKSGRQETRSASDASRPIKLPGPALRSSVSLLRALEIRKTTREISAKKLNLRALSNFLFAPCAVNRQEGPCRIPRKDSSNSREIDVYLALEEGIFLYDPYHHQLVPRDCR